MTTGLLPDTGDTMTYLFALFLNWTGPTLPVENPIHPKCGATLPVESPIKPMKGGAK